MLKVSEVGLREWLTTLSYSYLLGRWFAADKYTAGNGPWVLVMVACHERVTPWHSAKQFLQATILGAGSDATALKSIITSVNASPVLQTNFQPPIPRGNRQKSGLLFQAISYGAGNSKFLETEIGWISDFGRTSASQQKIILWDSGN